MSTRCRIAVRCCCQPQKLLGWVDSQWPFRSPILLERFESEPIIFDVTTTMKPEADFKVIRKFLPIGEFRDAGGRLSHALKAEGMTLEELKKFPAFIPNESGAE